MHLKPSYVYGTRWRVDPKGSRPLAETTYRVYNGLEAAGEKRVLEGRWTYLKVCQYPKDPTREDILLRRRALECQRDILALEHFMLPEPLDFCVLENAHDPGITGTDLQNSEPMLVYAHTPGNTLRAFMEDGDRGGLQEVLTPLAALDIIVKIIDGLAYLHEQGYGHAALNPDHLLYHNGSLRLLGLSKIGPIDRANGYLRLVEPPYLPPRERAFVPRPALVQRQFGLGTEYYALALLFLYLVTGAEPAPDAAQLEQQIGGLAICDPLAALLKGWLADWQRPYGGEVEAGYLKQLAAVRRGQQKYEADRRLAAARVGVFVDYENVRRSFDSGGRPERPVRLDFEALAAAYSEVGAVYRCIVMPQFRVRGLGRAMVEDLERAGWDVCVIGGSEGQNGGLAEKDDAALVQAATRFLQNARPLRLVLVANDRDYLALVTMARFRNVPVTVVLSRSPQLERQGVSGEYLRRLDEQKVEIRLFSAYPYVYADESVGAFAALGLRQRLPVAYAGQYRSLLWALHRAAGRERALDLLGQIRKQTNANTVLEVLKPLRFYDAAYHPFVARKLAQSRSPAVEIKTLASQQRLLARFDPGRPDLLDEVYQNATRDAGLVRLLTRAPASAAAHWDFLREHLGEPERALVELFLQPTPLHPQVAAAIKAAPQRYLALYNKLPRDLAQGLAGQLALHGPAAWDAMTRYEERGVRVIQEFGEEGLRVLAGPSASALLDGLATPATAKVLRQWYQTTGDLEAAPLLALNPELRERAQRAGPEGGAVVLQIFREQGALAAVDEVRDLAAATNYRMAGAYEAWQQLRSAGQRPAEVIRHAARLAGLTPPVFRPDLPAPAYVRLCLALGRAAGEGVLDDFLALYRAVKPDAALDAYGQYGPALFPVVQATDPFVVNTLRLFPDAFPALQRYGAAAYALLREYKDAANRALADLRAHDLDPLLGDEFAGRLVAAWYAGHHDLAALGMLAREPILLDWARQRAGGRDAQAGLEVLSLYAADPNPERMELALRIAQTAPVALREIHATLATLKQPTAGGRPVLERQASRIFGAPEPSLRVQAGRALLDAAGRGYEDALAGQIDLHGGAAIAAYNQFGPAVLLLARTISAEVIPLLRQLPAAFPHLERYGQAAHRFIKDWDGAGVKLLDGATAYNMTNALSATAQPWIRAWYDAYQNLDLVLLLAEDWRLMGVLQQCGWRPAQIWYALRPALGPAGFDRISQTAAVLADAALDMRLLQPLVKELAPATFNAVVKRYYDEWRRYPDVAVQVRVCRLLGETLRDDFPRHADRYAALAATVDRGALLDLVEKAGRPALDLLEALPPPTRTLCLSQVGRQPVGQAKAAVAAWLAQRAWLAGLGQASQVKAFQAAARQPVNEVVTAWLDYGDDGLDEIIRNGGIGVLFRLTHRKRR